MSMIKVPKGILQIYHSDISTKKRNIIQVFFTEESLWEYYSDIRGGNYKRQEERTHRFKNYKSQQTHNMNSLVFSVCT